MIVIIKIIVLLALAYWGMWAAGKRNRNKTVWFIATFLLAIPSLIAVYVAKPLGSTGENDKLGKIMLVIGIVIAIGSFIGGTLQALQSIF